MIPSFPSGATIGSIHVAAVDLGRFASFAASVPQIYGIRTDVANRFGLLADAFAANVLDGVLSGSELIERHTAFPVFASLLTPESKTLWKAAQLEGDTTVWPKYFPVNPHGMAYAEHPRMCPACVHDDRERFGIAYWRVCHQIPSVGICEVHGEILHDRCAACGAPFPTGTRSKAPGSQCSRCGASGTSPLEKANDSAGARSYAALIARAAQSKAPELAPEVRIRLFRRAFAGRRADESIDRLLTYWKARSLRGLETALGCKVSLPGLRRIFATGSGQAPFAVVVALVAFAAEDIGAKAVEDIIELARVDEVRLSRLDERARQSKVLDEALHAQARRLDLPVEVVSALLCHETRRASELAGRLNLAVLIDLLSPEHQRSIPLWSAVSQ